jgi:hypothetical protein
MAFLKAFPVGDTLNGIGELMVTNEESFQVVVADMVEERARQHNDHK